MKSKLFYILTLLSIITIFTGCSNEKNNSESSQNDEIPEMLEVQINLDTENPQPNQEVTISALVTQGDEKVDDADEVLFEVWKDGQEEHEKIEGEHKGNGVYSISKSFPEEGVWYVNTKLDNFFKVFIFIFNRA
jgi:YtkA-like